MQTRYGPKHRAKPGKKHAARSIKKARRAPTLTRRSTDGQAPDPTRRGPSEPSPVNPPEHSPVKEMGVRQTPPEPTRPERSAVTPPRRTAGPPEDDFFTSERHDPPRPDRFGPSPRQRLGDTEAPRQSVGQFIKELPVLIVVALAIAIIVKTFIMQAFFIPSGSMENTLEVGDRVLVAKFLYRFVEPKHPDIVVFVSPVSPPTPEPERNLFGKLTNEIAEGLGLRSSEQDFIKRVIATEGQTVEVKVGSVFVNNEKIDEPYRHDLDPLPDYGPIVVPPGTVFVMGDNRSNSEDSRVFGPIAKSSIIGRAFVLIWPLNRVSWLGG